MKKQVVWISCLVLLLSGVVWASPGVDAYKNKEYQKAYELLKPLADKGDAQAMHYIGKMYYKGMVVSKDVATAVMWWRQAAQKGYLDSIYNMGWAYKYGKGVEKNFKKAMKWYLLAADGGNKSAMYTLGNMYKNGQGIQKDYKGALNWYHLAWDKGHKHAGWAIGDMYKNGLGVQKDSEKALAWFHRAANKGSNVAFRQLGLVYQWGWSVKADQIKAYSYYLLAAKKGSKSAIKDADGLKAQLTSSQISQAQKIANNWSPSKDDNKILGKSKKESVKKKEIKIAKNEEKPKIAKKKTPTPSKLSPKAAAVNSGCFNTDGALESCQQSCVKTESNLKNVTDAEKKIRVSLCQQGCAAAQKSLPDAYTAAAQYNGDKNYCWQLEKSFEKIVDNKPYKIAKSKNLSGGQKRSYVFGWGRYQRIILANSKKAVGSKQIKPDTSDDNVVFKQQEPLKIAQMNEIMSQFFE